MKQMRFFILFIFMGAASLPQAALAKDATGFIDGLGKEVIDIISVDEGMDARQTKLEKIFYRAVDVNWIARFVLGKHWRRADKAQKDRYMEAYGPYIVNAYASRFNEYTGEKFNVMGARKTDQGFHVVDVEIERPAAANVVVQFRVHDRAKKMQIFDVVIEGVSQLTTQRSEFNTIITRKNMDYLIDKLEERGKSFSENVALKN
jgi:phospholipid transport system substrate-binding protein